MTPTSRTDAPEGPKPQLERLKSLLRGLLTARRPENSPSEDSPGSEGEETPSGYSLVVITQSRSGKPDDSDVHWAIALVTDERARQCRVYHVSDRHVSGLRALGWTAFAQDEVLGPDSGCRGGVRIGVVLEEEREKLEEVVTSGEVPEPVSSTWDCEDWAVAVVKYLSMQEEFALLGLSRTVDGGEDNFVNRLVCDVRRAERLTEKYGAALGPAFVSLSLG
ncbi:hypothetical protein C8Q76DRAFT_298681 [Earliella scabrosa]|nr:hypothetical protein C8Q76DRAFT_298681 [Earliella scabrosa]